MVTVLLNMLQHESVFLIQRELGNLIDFGNKKINLCFEKLYQQYNKKALLAKSIVLQQPHS